MLFAAGTLAAVLVFAASAEALGGATSKPPVIGLGSLNGAKPGMSAARVAAAWSVPVKVVYSRAFPDCGTADVKLGGVRVTVWFPGRVFGRVDFERRARTSAGIVLGSTVAALRKAYGLALRAHRQPYSAPAVSDYDVRSTEKPATYIYFSMSAGHVKKIYFGDDFVFAEEGCA